MHQFKIGAEESPGRSGQGYNTITIRSVKMKRFRLANRICVYGHVGYMICGASWLILNGLERGLTAARKAEFWCANLC